MPKKTKTSCGTSAGRDMNNRPLAVCNRVEIAPYHDLWMRGAKYGTIVRYDTKSEVAVVRMDNRRVRRLQRMRPETLKKV